MTSKDTSFHRQTAKARRIFLSAMAIFVLNFALVGLVRVLQALRTMTGYHLPIVITACVLWLGACLMLVLAIRSVRCPGCRRVLANVMSIFGSRTRVSYCPYCGYRLAEGGA